MADNEDDQGQEKSFEPTHKKLEDAREQGNVPQSKDVNAAASYIALIAALLAAGTSASMDFGRALAPFIGQVDQLTGRILAPGGLALAGAMVGKAALAASPLMLVPAIAVLASLVGQRALVISTDKIEPKLSRVSPMENAKQKFGPTGLMEFVKSTVKMTLIGTGGWLWIAHEAPRLVGLSAANARRLPAEIGATLLSLLTVITGIAVAIAVVDMLWQRYDHARKLRMSYEDLRKESKETEGDPYMKMSRRRRGEEIAMNRMLLDVPKADVVIVNPTHYAVALTWNRLPGSAPICVAKGVDEVAALIRERAATAGVPIHRDPPTARDLHATVEIGREIAPRQYRAVAAALRFAAEMRRKARERSW